MEGKNSKPKYGLKEVQIRLKVKEGDSLYSMERIDRPERAIKLLADFMKDLDRECIYVINFDTKMHPISFNMAGMGGINYAPTDPGNIFKSAILTNAANIMVLHVHPSGDYTPSEVDIEMTKRVVLAGAVMGIPVQDHLIVAGGTGDFISIRETRPDIFAEPNRLAENRQELLSGLPMAVAEPSAATEQNTHQASPTIYNEVLELINRQQELMRTAPEAWQLATESVSMAMASTGQEMKPNDYETQTAIADAARKILDNDTEKITTSLADIGKASQDIAVAKTVLTLIARIAKYDGEWEPAPEEMEQIFNASAEPKQQEVQPQKEAETPKKGKSSSFAEELNEKSKEAAMLNAARTGIQQPQRQQQTALGL